VLTSEPVVRVYAKRLEVKYDAFVPTHLQPYQNTAVSAASIMSNGFPNEKTVRDINIFLAALYFGELRFLGLWGREAFAPAMLAQAVVTVCEQRQSENVQPFQFPQQKG
jgi:hypothetical protein